LDTTIDDPYPALLGAISISGDSLLFYVVAFLTLILLLFLSALVSGSEVAFFSFEANDLKKFKASKDSREQRIVTLLSNPRQLLATILVLNNFVNIAFVTLITFVAWKILNTRQLSDYYLVILTTISTLSLVFIGEVVPKVYANQSNINFAKRTCGLLAFSQVIFSPLSWVLLKITGLIEQRVERKGYDISLEELNNAIELTADENTPEEEKDILKGIVNFGNLSVKQVMRSRLEITAFDIAVDFHDLMDKVNKTGYSRIPVYKETIDKVEGILYIKDLLPFIEQDESFQWQDLLRPGFFIPESKKIDSLLRDFQEKRVHMAIVVDEYGGTSGLITLEDVIEEIVGEINDEFDEDEIAHNKLDEHTYIFEGRTSLNDFCKVVNIENNIFDPVKGESESLGGLLLELNSKMPVVGEKISFDRFTFTVVSVDHKRIKRIRVYIAPQPAYNEQGS